ncbi:MAG: hypothetical protein KAS16_04290 [Thermoplasmata archaeon]|nr:hypothetical protein [Thermoplasmata archaeon]
MAKKKTGTKSKRSSSKKEFDTSEYSEKLFDWLSDGYEVSELTALIKSGTPTKIKKAFSQHGKTIKRLKELEDEVHELDVDEDDLKYQKILTLLKNPSKVELIERYVESMSDVSRIADLKAELSSLNITGFEKEAKAILSRISNGDDPDDIENNIKILKKRIKEKFFESSFAMELTPEQEKERGVIKHAPLAETIFFIHRDGTLLSVKSKIPPEDLSKKLLSRMVMAIREQMNRAYNEGEHVHMLAYEGHSIILEDSNHVYAAVVINGEVKPIMYKIILKALQIMERKYASNFDNWTGDRKKLTELEKYSTAIFQAFEKLN